MTCSSSHSSSGRITSLKQQQYQSDFGSSGCEKNHLSLSQPSSIGVSPHAISESRLTSGTYERDIAVPGRVASSISGSDGSYRISGTRRNVAASSPSTGHGRSKCDASCFGSSSSDSSHDLSSSKHLKSANKYFGENGSDISLSDVAPLSEPVAAPRRCEVDFLSLDSVLSTKDLQGDVLESHFISGTHERDFSSMSHVESSRLITDANYGSSGTIQNAAPSFAPNRGRHVTSSLSNVTDSSSVKHVHSGRKPLEENRLEMNSQGVFFNSATDVQPELYHINQVSIELFGCCELTMSLSPVIWEYIEKYHDRELRDIKKYCQLDVLKKPDGELSMMVKTSSYRKFICKFEDVFKPLYEQLNLEIIEVKCDMIRRQDEMKIKDQLEEFKCVVHMYGGGHLRIICQISDKEVVEGIVQHFAEGSVKNDQIGSLPLPARGFAPTGYIVNNSIEIFIHINDITSLDVDAITNPSNPWLEALGGLSGVIAGKAGFDFEDECCGIMAKRGRELNVGEVVHTGGGKLQAPFVIHVTGPIWPTNPTQDNMLGCLFVLIEVFQNIISYADDRGFKTIAIPPISSGNC
jgi:O-acetyl-ADP-ribose deacetylase (regulator of RNase III)